MDIHFEEFIDGCTGMMSPPKGYSFLKFPIDVAKEMQIEAQTRRMNVISTSIKEINHLACLKGLWIDELDDNDSNFYIDTQDESQSESYRMPYARFSINPETTESLH